MGPGLMSALGLSLGSPVLVHVPGGSCLCTAWPRSDLAEGFLQIDQKCFTPSLISPFPPRLNIEAAQLTPLPCPKLRCVKVTVVVQTIGFKKHTDRQIVHEIVKDMLKGITVHKDFVISLEYFDIEIKYVVIDGLHPDSATAGLITHKTSVEISNIQTVRHFKSQQQKQETIPLGGLEEVSLPAL